VDITATYEQKTRVLATHASQSLDYFGGTVDRLTTSWGARIASDEALDPLLVGCGDRRPSEHTEVDRSR